MHKVILWITVLVLMSGCKTSLQSNWKNFNAYYNTYYNAEKSYEAGLQKNLAQKRGYNPLQPIQIHLKPVNAGSQDFDKAIRKAADILRRHDDSKWVDDAIFLIGKSYYYQQEYFSADQKFKELYITSEDPEMQHKSILWQGRVLLGMERYTEGIAFLSEQLTAFEDEWEEKRHAEAKALLAQHHVALENWQLAAELLYEALPHLQKKDYRERGYFLLGQVFEKSDAFDEAYEAYSRVRDHHTEYRVQYLAHRKRAEVARKLGRNDLALRIFENMIRDDKNLEFKAELDFELAQTEHELGNYKQAEKLYNDVLHRNTSQPPAEIVARAYNGLAEIYRFGYDDFSMAAAYYDSAAQKNVPRDRLPEDFEAALLAESFGNYARIKSEIALQDSLLRLGQLSESELDSVLVEQRKKKIQELEALRKQEQQQQNQLVTVDQNDDSEETITSNGFLNANNPLMQQRMRQQFYAVWGNRPLADNWRVRRMIKASAYSDEDKEDEILVDDTGLLNIEIDLSGIPFTPEEQDSVRKRIAGYHYELGNLFFLSLNMPDSAVHYFLKAVENPSGRNIDMVSLYSLSELNQIEGNEAKAKEYALQLVESYPNSEYALRVANQYDLPLNYEGNFNEVNPIQLYGLILQQDSLDATSKAERLKTFSYNFSSHKIAPQAQLEAIQAYMEAGKKDSLYESKIEAWVNFNQNWEQTTSEFEAAKDSAKSLLQDTSIVGAQRMEIQSLIDSTLQKPAFSSVFPYRGANWDSARAVADTFLVMFPDSKFQPRVSRLKQEFKIPNPEDEVVAPGAQSEPEVNEVDTEYVNCEDIGVELNIRGGIQQFMGNWNKPEDLYIQELTYHFKVNQRGIVDEFTLLTEDVPEKVKAGFEPIIEDFLSFEPILYEGQALSLDCNFTFPIED